MRRVRRRSSEHQQVFLSLQEYRRQVITFACDVDGAQLSSVVFLSLFKGKKLKVWTIAVLQQLASLLQELTCKNHTVLLVKVTFPLLPQPVKAGTQFSIPGGMQFAELT